MKPAASLSAKLLVRKGHATPSNLRRRFAHDDPTFLPDPMDAAPSSDAENHERRPIIDDLDDVDSDFWDSGYAQYSPEGLQQDFGPSEIRDTEPQLTPSALPQPDPKPMQADSTPIMKPLKMVGEDLPPQPTFSSSPVARRGAGATTKPVRRPVGAAARIAMTVRLDHDQHNELHLFADSRGRSCQDVFVRALETYMAIYRQGDPRVGNQCQ